MTMCLRFFCFVNAKISNRIFSNFTLLFCFLGSSALADDQCATSPSSLKQIQIGQQLLNATLSDKEVAIRLCHDANEASANLGYNLHTAAKNKETKYTEKDFLDLLITGDKIPEKYFYLLGQHPSPNVRKKLFDVVKSRTAKKYTANQFDSEFQKALDGNILLTSAEKLNFAKKFSPTSASFNISTEAATHKVLTSVCKNENCPGSVDIIEQIIGDMNPKGAYAYGAESGILSMPDLIKKRFVDPKFLQGSAKMLKKINEKISSKINSTDDLLSDLMSSYKSTGLNEQESTEMAWDFLAIYSTRGMSLQALDGLSVGSHTKLQLEIFKQIAAGIQVLDAKQLSTGTQYSVPKSINSRCLVGKPYHFWLPAYFARKYRDTKTNPSNDSAHAAFLSSVGYNYKAEMEGRNSEHKNSEQYLDFLRPSLSLAAAGAAFGSGNTSPEKRKSIEEGISAGKISIATSSSFLEKLINLDKASGFFDFREKLGAKSTINYFLSTK